MKCKSKTLVAFAAPLFILATSLAIAWPFIFGYILKSNLALSEKSKSYKMWIETPLPMFLDIYLFNWKNAAHFAKNQKLKPSFEEIGPFVFREVHDRVNITWNSDGTVSYNQTRKWTLVPELSMDMNTLITNVDVIALGAAHATRYSGFVVQELLAGLLKFTSNIYVTKPAKEWLFEGMNLPILKVLNDIEKFKHLPFAVPDKFGFFYQRNMSADYDGRFQILTGSNELTDLGNMKMWNSVNKTDFFKDYCAMVNGSSGEIFAPLKSNETDFTIFITDVCSSLTLKYAQDKTYGGLTGKQFVGDATMFDNGQNVTERACFCEGECQPAGVRNLTRCRQGAPVFVSFPHFYLADPTYLSSIEGLSPNKTLHEFQLTIDPLSGIPLDVRASLQVNVLLQNYPMYGMYKNISKKIYMPMIWFSQRAHVTKDILSEAKLLNSIESSVAICLYATIGIASFIMVVFSALHLWKKYREEDLEPLIQETIED